MLIYQPIYFNFILIRYFTTDFFKVEIHFSHLPTSWQNELSHLLTIYRYSKHLQYMQRYAMHRYAMHLYAMHLVQTS